MNQTLQLLFRRASCRAFTGKKVPAAVVKKMLKAGIQAPTGGNLQPYSVIKIEKKSAIDRLAKLCGQSFMKKAPLHFIFCVDFHRLKRWAKLESAPFTADRSLRPFWIAFQDTILCAQNMCIAADALGLGSVYIGPIFDRIPEIRKMCHLPKGVVPVVSLVVGYPAVFPAPRKRLGEKIVMHNEVYRDIDDKELLEVFSEKYKGVRREITKKDLETLYRVCRNVHGSGFAEKSVRAAKNLGYINRAQVYFGLNYQADRMLSGTPKQLKMLSKAGLPCFLAGSRK
jgi:FMN reductase [NAD(P)H]